MAAHQKTKVINPYLVVYLQFIERYKQETSSLQSYRTALFYHDFTLSGLWNTTGEQGTLIGNTFIQRPLETPPTAPEIALNMLGIFAIVTAGRWGIEKGKEMFEKRRTRRSTAPTH